MVDALALGADEGRGRLRYASGSCQPSVDEDVRMGKPGTSDVVSPISECIAGGGERGEVKHLSTRRKRKQL